MTTAIETPATYLGLLRIRGAMAFVVPATVGRFPQAMLGIGTVLLVEGFRGSYGLAGAVSAVIALSGGVASPVVGRLADRFGQFRTVLAGLVVVIPSLLGLVAATAWGLPAWTLFVLAALSGASYPFFGSYSRVRWSRLTSGASWDRALALESVIDEASYVVGPVAAALLATTVAPSAPLVGGAIVVAVAGTFFLAARSSEPLPGEARQHRAGARPAVLEPGMPALALTMVALGALFGSTEVTVIAFAERAGEPGAAGPLLAVWSLTSLIAGLVYGAWRWRSGPGLRLAWSATLIGVAGLTGPWAGGILALGLALALVGIAVAPVLISANALAAVLVADEALTEGFAWLSVSILVGVAGGAAVAGAVVDAEGPGTALWMMSITAAAVTACAWAAAFLAGHRAKAATGKAAAAPGSGGPVSEVTRP